MKKVIGIVSEGPTDYLVLKTAIDKITGEENKYLRLQPEADMIGRYGNGWKGVWKWCREAPLLREMMSEIQPGIDLIVIQMDGDVIRKEKEIHCLCDATLCAAKGQDFPLYCQKAQSGCPVKMPCQSHKYDIAGIMDHGTTVLRNTLVDGLDDRIIITIPCDSTDTWVAAAYDDYENVEEIADPWRNIIAKGKFYHDIRVRGEKKNTVTYQKFLKTLSENWNFVTEKCYSARIFEMNVKKVILHPPTGIKPSFAP